MALTHSGTVSPSGGCAFRAGQQIYCVPATVVLAVISFPRLTALPHAPDSLLGIADAQITDLHMPSRAKVVNLSGAAVPVMDVRLASGADSTFTASQNATEAWKYVVVMRVPMNGEEVLLGTAAHDVWHTSVMEEDDVLDPSLFDRPASAGPTQCVRIEGGTAGRLDVAAIAEGLRAAAVA